VGGAGVSLEGARFVRRWVAVDSCFEVDVVNIDKSTCGCGSFREGCVSESDGMTF